MRKILLALTAALTLAGCEGQMEKQIRESMNDPAAAQFQEKVTLGNWACVSVNGKNAYGGYVGFKRYTMKNSPMSTGDIWTTVSREAACDKDTLAKTVKQEEELDAAEQKIRSDVAARILSAMKEGKLVSAGSTHPWGLENEKCSLAAVSGETEGVLAYSARSSNNSAFEADFDKRIEGFKKGSCAEPN